MSRQLETPSFPKAGLFGGEFFSDRFYENHRASGTGDWLLIYTVAGAGYLTTGEKKGPTEMGEAILYAPGELQDYKTDPITGRWQLCWVHFVPKPAWHPWLQWASGAHGVKSVQLEAGEEREHFRMALRRMLAFQQRHLPNATDLAFNALEEALLWARLSAPRGGWSLIDSRIRKAMDYLASDLRQPFRLDALARRCGLSVSRLAHLFKAEAGVSPQQFFEQQRMGQAKQLLRLTGLNIAEVAAEVGYDDPFYFSNRFRRLAGNSPSEFRRKQKAK